MIDPTLYVPGPPDKDNSDTIGVLMTDGTFRYASPLQGTVRIRDFYASFLYGAPWTKGTDGKHYQYQELLGVELRWDELEGLVVLGLNLDPAQCQG